MISKVQKWGNSQGIRIPKNLLKNTQIEIGEDVDISIKAGKIIIKPTNKIKGRYSISDLASKMPKEYNPKEENWGIPVGKEAW